MGSIISAAVFDSQMVTNFLVFCCFLPVFDSQMVTNFLVFAVFLRDFDSQMHRTFESPAKVNRAGLGFWEEVPNVRPVRRGVKR